MASDEEALSEKLKILYIKEQDLRLANEIKPYYSKTDDLYVIIAREINFRLGINNGDLRVGIIRIPDPNNADDFELVLPFSKRLIYAKIENGVVRLSYIEGKSLKAKSIFLNSEGKLNFEDYAFLLDSEREEIEYNIEHRALQR